MNQQSEERRASAECSSRLPWKVKHVQSNHAPHAGTQRTMFHIISSRAVSITFDGSVRVFVSAAQQNPVGVRTIIVVEPGRLPLCHQFPESTLTIHPLAYLAGVVCG